MITSDKFIFLVGAALTIVVLLIALYGIYLCIQRKSAYGQRWQRFLEVTDAHSLFLLFIIIILIAAWFGVNLFNNPYSPIYNHGNASYYAQVLHNISSGIGPEQTTKYTTLNLQDNPYFYASAYTISPQILSPLILSLLYRLYPYPPMHVFSVILVVISLGTVGIYLALRAMGSSKNVSLMGAVGYCIMPWVEMSIHKHGAFDCLGYAIYPYIFAALFSRRWISFYISIFLFSLLNIAYAYAAIALGLVVILFFKSPKHGIIALLIALAIAFWEKALMDVSLNGIWQAVAPRPGLYELFVKNSDMLILLKSLLSHFIMILVFLASVAFLPIFAIRKKGKWNLPIIGLLCFVCMNVLMSIFRGHSLVFHRNSNFIVPIYLSAFLAYASICNVRNHAGGVVIGDRRKYSCIGMLLFSVFIAMSLWGSKYYPWSGVKYLVNETSATDVGGPGSPNIFRKSAKYGAYDRILSNIRENVPEDASVAYRIDAGLQAFIANRQKAWIIGEHPAGVEYYVIQIKPVDYIDDDLGYARKIPWRETIIRLERSKTHKILYEDDLLVIYKNNEPKQIPRYEPVLCWDILLHSVVPTKWSMRM